MQTLIHLPIQIAEQMVLFILIVAVLAAVMIALNLSSRSRPLSLDDTSRLGENEDIFVHSLLVCGFDPGIARTTFRYLEEKQHPASPIRALDHLDQDLRLHGAAVEQSLHELLRMNGRIDQTGLLHSPLVTVQDLVGHIQSSPRLSELAA